MIREELIFQCFLVRTLRKKSEKVEETEVEIEDHERTEDRDVILVEDERAEDFQIDLEDRDVVDLADEVETVVVTTDVVDHPATTSPAPAGDLSFLV
jgi:hypothetical protein